ncbi:MAG: excinuclease ABC subunit C [Bdellovibrionales bacterium]|nr:excinuclease ABC subunit C [Bdellovibrionales bacterium]
MENAPSKPNRHPLLEAAKAASLSPGVYLMKDENGTVLYVGKAKNLKNRLTTYFQPEVHPIPRIEMLVCRVERFDVILTETEDEALILECTLIKKHRPKFNVRLKDDKAYPYLKINLNDPFPRIEWIRRVKRDGARYFGPFPSAYAAREVMELLNESFRLRDCSDNTFRHRSRPCILYQMDKCTAPCVTKISKEDYRSTIAEAMDVLEGKSDRLIREMREQMEDASDREEYEEAATLRDRIRNLEIVTATQMADEAGRDRNRDVAAVARKDLEAHGALLQIRGGRMVAVRHYQLQNTDPSQSDADLLFDFLAQYYAAADQAAEVENSRAQAEAEQGLPAGQADLPHASGLGFEPGGPALARPNEVLLASAPTDPELLERTYGIKVRVPETIGEKQLISVATTNAQHALEQNAKRAGGHSAKSLEEVQEKLQLTRLPRRIECYDNSNIQGEEAVASRVVFIDGAPDKNLYRRYKIKTVEGANDFATMREVLSRRFSHTDEELPDLVVVDGGKGQLSQATAILEELGIQGLGVVGLAKARTESDFQATEVKQSHERIFIPGRKNPVNLLPHTEAYKLLVHVRDEAHRFAISYHRLLRQKKSLASQTRKKS